MVVQIKSKKRSVIVITTTVVACFVFTIIFYIVSADFLLSLVTSILFVTFYYLFASNKETASNILHPYSYFIIVIGLISYGLPVALAIIDPNNPFVLRMPTENLVIVIILITGSFVMYGVGYRMSIGRQMARAVPLFCFQNRISREWFILSALALYGVGWLARITAWKLGFHHMNPNLGEFTMVVSSVLSPLSVFSTLSYIVLLWDRFSYVKKNRLVFPFSSLVIVLIILEVVAGMIQGSRSRMIFPLLFVAFVYNYTICRLTWRHLLFGIIVLVGVLAPAATLYRTVYFDTLGEGGASLAGANESIERLYESEPELQSASAIVAVAGRLSVPLEGALVVYDKVPREIEFAIGSTFVPSALLNFVPRILWTGKPIVMPGREFAQIFWDLNVGEMYATNMEIGLIGEAYYNFGWFGLVIPMVFGVVLKVFVVRLEDYSSIEVYWAPRLFFAVFIVNAIGPFHYYPSDLVRGALFIMLYMSILNHGFPRMLRFRARHASHQRLANMPRTPL